MTSIQLVTGEEQSVKRLPNSLISVREAKIDDAHALGVICFEAFKAFNSSVGIDYKIDFPSTEMSVELMRNFMEGPEKVLFSAVAVKNETGQLIGSGFLHNSDSDAYSIGPLSVDPGQSNMGGGKAIMTSLLDRAKQDGAPSVRLMQVAPNTKSFSLYSSLGFYPRDCYAAFWGTVEPEQAAAAASAVGLAPNPDAVVRLMEEADVPSCAQFFKDTNGYDRLQGIQRCLGPHSWVITSKVGEILGYTTGFELFKHTCVGTESDFITLFHGVATNVQYKFLLALSTSRYPKLSQWALAARLRLIRHNWYMVIGDYQAPKDNRVYFPSTNH